MRLKFTCANRKPSGKKVKNASLNSAWISQRPGCIYWWASNAFLKRYENWLTNLYKIDIYQLLGGLVRSANWVIIFIYYFSFVSDPFDLLSSLFVFYCYSRCYVFSFVFFEKGGNSQFSSIFDKSKGFFLYIFPSWFSFLWVIKNM